MNRTTSNGARIIYNLYQNIRYSFLLKGNYTILKFVYNSDMNRCSKYKCYKTINKIFVNYFHKFRNLKWYKVKKEMCEHIIGIVERTLNCINLLKVLSLFYNPNLHVNQCHTSQLVN